MICVSLAGLVFGLLGLAADSFRIRSSKRSQAKTRSAAATEPLEPTSDDLDAQLRSQAADLSAFPTCHLSRSDCSLKDMKEDTLVFIDQDDARCMNGEPWAFVVHPGDVDKLFVFFGPGGGCWEGDSDNFEPRLCTDDMAGSVPQVYGEGAFDFSDSRNIFKDYTYIGLPYCTGGAHVASTVVEWEGDTYYQYGYNNDEYARQWMMTQFANNAPFESFVIGGSSAGAMGAAIWSDRLLSTFRYEKASVLMDSYLGVFPAGTQGPTFVNWNCCNGPLWEPFPESLISDCNAGNGDFQVIVDHIIGKWPNVAFTHIQPKEDLVQRGYYSAVARSFGDFSLVLGSGAFYKITNEMMETYNKHPNYVVYMLDDNSHTSVQLNTWYTANTAGDNGLVQPEGKPSLVEWTAEFIQHGNVQSECYGDLDRNGARGRYCYKDLFPKTLQM